MTVAVAARVIDKEVGCPEKSGDTVGLGCELRRRRKSVTVEEEEAGRKSEEGEGD